MGEKLKALPLVPFEIERKRFVVFRMAPVELLVAQSHYLSTSYVERRNLNPRMGMRRFTRLTNGFSKKVEPHYWMVCLYTVFHDFVRMYKTLRCTPGPVAGLSKTLWNVDDLVAMIDAGQRRPNGPASIK